MNIHRGNNAYVIQEKTALEGFQKTKKKSHKQKQKKKKKLPYHLLQKQKNTTQLGGGYVHEESAIEDPMKLIFAESIYRDTRLC